MDEEKRQKQRNKNILLLLLPPSSSSYLTVLLFHLLLPKRTEWRKATRQAIQEEVSDKSQPLAQGFGYLVVGRWPTAEPGHPPLW